MQKNDEEFYTIHQDYNNGIEQIHCHKTNTCYYDDRPQDTENGSVTDAHIMHI